MGHARCLDSKIMFCTSPFEKIDLISSADMDGSPSDKIDEDDEDDNSVPSSSIPYLQMEWAHQVKSTGHRTTNNIVRRKSDQSQIKPHLVPWKKRPAQALKQRKRGSS